MNKRILIVGRELGAGLSRGAQSGGVLPGSEFVFVGSPAEAGPLLQEGQIHAVVTDLVLHDMEGTRFLDQVKEKCPDAVRVVCADLSRPDLATRCLGLAHQVLTHPIDFKTLQTALDRAITLQTWMPDKHVQRLVSGVRQVPSPPTLYFQVVRELQQESASTSSIGELIAKDAAMTAKLLQLANSAVFGLSLQVNDPVDAIMYLGIETTKSLILMAHTFSYFERLKGATLRIEELWRHSLLTGNFARRIAEAVDADQDLVTEAFTSGLLHDLGKLVMAANYPDQFTSALEKARSDNCPLWQAERDLWNATHADIGAALLGVWSLPMGVVQAVAWHHSPVCLLGKGFSALAAVHVANVLAHHGEARPESTQHGEIDTEYIREIGLLDRLPAWEAACLPDG